MKINNKLYYENELVEITINSQTYLGIIGEIDEHQEKFAFFSNNLNGSILNKDPEERGYIHSYIFDFYEFSKEEEKNFNYKIKKITCKSYNKICQSKI